VDNDFKTVEARDCTRKMESNKAIDYDMIPALGGVLHHEEWNRSINKYV
jgi:hypothetical protein